MRKYLDRIKGSPRRQDNAACVVDIPLRSRASGAIWGVCIADALGGPVQFMAPGSFEPVTDLAPIVMYQKPKGAFSDDGSMTLALAQAFIDAKGDHEPDRVQLASVRYYLDWIFKGKFSSASHAWDTGISTRRSLTLWKWGMWGEDREWRDDAAARWAETQKKVVDNLDKENASGNGSLMRIAPVGVVMFADREAACEAARNQSRVTHPAPACVQACDLYTDLVCRVMKGETKDELAKAVAAFRPSHEILADRLSVYSKLSHWEKTAPDDIRSTGWVIDTIEVALWAFFKYSSWKEGALAVVNLGGDSDTAGAVYGGLAGAFYGYEAIPQEWISEMQRRDLIEEIAQGVMDLVGPVEAP